MSPSKGTPLVAFRLRPAENRGKLEAEMQETGETLTDLMNRIVAEHLARRDQGSR